MRLERSGLTPVIVLAIFIVAVIYYIFPGQTLFVGAHTMYTTENSTDYGYAEFCVECHGAIVRNITSSPAHNSTVCICHGYNPNTTDMMRNVNLTHNLTKNAYCTNCHTDYNETGHLYIYARDSLYINAINQSGHYIMFNKSNTTLMDELYNRSWRYFNRSFGPLPS